MLRRQFGMINRPIPGVILLESRNIVEQNSRADDVKVRPFLDGQSFSKRQDAQDMVKIMSALRTIVERSSFIQANLCYLLLPFD